MTKSKSPDQFPLEMCQEISKNLSELVYSGKMFRYEYKPDQVQSTMTGEAARLERDIAAYLGRKFGVAVNSCGSALFLSLKAGGFKAGDKCFSNAFTFTAVPGCITHAGGIPVLIECLDNFTIDIEDLRTKIKENPSVKFFILSHMRGHINDMDTISKICQEEGIFLIDDCAHALGGEYDGKLVGSFGAPVACFSAQSNKMINSGEGGLLVTIGFLLIA